MKREIVYVAAILISSHLHAQQDSAYKNLDEVVTTANKYPQKQSSTGKVLTVVTREMLQNNSGRTLSQVLNEQSGIIINGAQNSPGTNQTVYMRGASVANTLILVDGVPVNDASGISNEFDLNHFQVDQIERVEILKGAQSVLYGSDAVAGVINIITRKQVSHHPVGFNGSLAGGTFGSFKGTAGISGHTDKITYNTQYTRETTKGFSSAIDTTGKAGYDKDGLKQHVASGQITFTPTKDWRLRLDGSFSEYKIDIDDAPFQDDQNNRIRNKSVFAGLNAVRALSNGSVTVNLNLNQIDRNLHDDVNANPGPNDFDPYYARYKGNVFFAEAYTNLRFSDKVGLVAGADFKGQKANITSIYSSLSDDSLHANQFSGYASLLLSPVDRLHIEAGARLTKHSNFGTNLSWSVNPAYYITKQVKLFGNIATGFRAPSLYNLASEYGNRDVQPEKSFSLEGGLQVTSTSGKVNARATAFLRNIKDVILFKSLFVPPYGQYDNGDKQKDRGLELELTVRPTTLLRFTANYAFVEGHIDTKTSASKDTSFFNLYRRPKHSGNVSIGYQVTPKLYVSTSARWVSERTDLYFDPNSFETLKKKLAGYYNWDAYAAYQLVKRVRLYVDVRNITNVKYADLYGYNVRRFNMMGGVQVGF